MIFSIFTMSEFVEQRSAIKFCLRDEISVAETFRMLQKTFDDLTISQKNVYKSYEDFKEGRERVDDLEPRVELLILFCFSWYSLDSLLLLLILFWFSFASLYTLLILFCFSWYFLDSLLLLSLLFLSYTVCSTRASSRDRKSVV